MLEAGERLPEGGLRAGLRAEACVAAWQERFRINTGHGEQRPCSLSQTREQILESRSFSNSNDFKFVVFRIGVDDSLRNSRNVFTSHRKHPFSA